MTTVAEHFIRTSRRRLAWIAGLFAAWTIVVALDVLYGIAKRDWMGLPVFLLFCGALIYLFFFTPVRCPSCRSAIHSVWWQSFRPHPHWVPRWIARFFPRRTHCSNCGLAFSTDISQVEQRPF